MSTITSSIPSTASEAARRVEAQDIRNRWLLSAPALVIIALAAIAVR